MNLKKQGTILLLIMNKQEVHSTGTIVHTGFLRVMEYLENCIFIFQVWRKKAKLMEKNICQ